MYWWGKQVSIGVFSVFFLIFGIDLLAVSYRLDNPHEFIMCFFSSSLIINDQRGGNTLSCHQDIYPLKNKVTHSPHR